MNLTFLGLCLACFGVSLAEGLMMSSLLKSASRQPEIIGQLRSLLILGVAFVEGTFFVTLVMAFNYQIDASILEKEVSNLGRKVSIQRLLLDLYLLI